MANFLNPLIDHDGADPFLFFHDEEYYLAVTRGEFISVRHAPTLAELKVAPEIEVWRDESPRRFMHMWAPEFFFLDGHWWLYYTASDKSNDAHRCYVLQSKTDSPLGPYEFKAQLLTDALDAFYAIDATVIENARGQRFCIWAAFPLHRLFVCAMENPYTLHGERQMIEADGFGCEEVREGPICLKRNGKIFLIYSICDTAKPDYKLGMLWADESANLANPEVWNQHPRPVFTRCDENGVYGPGHNSFFRDKSGDDWICYHAKSTKKFTCANRTTRVQRFGWDENGFPDFGVPLSLKTPIQEPETSEFHKK
ncbi:Beta-xylosidase, GH43 family [Abditibacterium utsteinense]|uniref:Beta-xylosidase, GH43 family n=1 Tax=Abditibacterium utsteinense TaxID=1960156 RepID=A0A2S8SUB0_9BACT|nr:glycoside hydrolase family 43 protein [Abditibacterium utsteinense]PQV64381.1 Beta-xylosidase, GH43 family [Abditibacterium utsteinense]